MVLNNIQQLALSWFLTITKVLCELARKQGQSLGAVLGSDSEKESGDSNKDSMSDKEAMNGNGNDSASSKDKEPPTKRIRQPKDEPDAWVISIH